MLQKAISIIKSPASKTAGIYTFSNFFIKGTSFLLLFIYSNPKYLSVHENGLLSLLTSSVFILMPFLSLGIVQSTSVDFFKLKGDEFKSFFTTGFVIPICIMFLAFAGLFVFSNDLKSAYDFPWSFVLIIPVLTFLNFCNEQFLTIVRNNDEPVTFLKAALLRLGVEISLSLTLVVVFFSGWQGRVTGILASNTVLLFIAFFYLKKKNYLFGKIKRIYIRQELLYGFPIIILQCSTFCLFYSDKFFLSFFSDNSEVGVYSYACVFAAVVNLGSSALLYYVMPKIYSFLSESKIDYKQIRKHFLFYVSSCFILLLCVVAFTPLLYKFFINSSYHPGLKYFYLIAAGYFFWSVTYFFYTFMFYKKHKKKILATSLISIFISIANNYFFIKNLGTSGAAFSVFLSYFLVLLVTITANLKNIKEMFFKGQKTGLTVPQETYFSANSLEK
ncbi:MAG: lipopolysaccharide biosynthesis protein [Ginsengibacter sp.]